jgi:ribA/ribD-fused uncharacterized protein
LIKFIHFNEIIEEIGCFIFWRFPNGFSRLSYKGVGMGEPIKFYHQNKPYGFFSNFSEHPIHLKGKIWPTSEHYFQAQKFTDTLHEEEVRLASSPMEAARIGRDRNHPLRPDWEEVKEDIMRQALLAKFTQHPDLKVKLLATGSAEIIEHTTNDSYWGDGGDGTGKNRLGKLLMEIREKIRDDRL